MRGEFGWSLLLLLRILEERGGGSGVAVSQSMEESVEMDDQYEGLSGRDIQLRHSLLLNQRIQG